MVRKHISWILFNTNSLFNERYIGWAFRLKLPFCITLFLNIWFNRVPIKIELLNFHEKFLCVCTKFGGEKAYLRQTLHLYADPWAIFSAIFSCYLFGTLIIKGTWQTKKLPSWNIWQFHVFGWTAISNVRIVYVRLTLSVHCVTKIVLIVGKWLKNFKRHYY